MNDYKGNDLLLILDDSDKYDVIHGVVDRMNPPLKTRRVSKSPEGHFKPASSWSNPFAVVVHLSQGVQRTHGSEAPLRLGDVIRTLRGDRTVLETHPNDVDVELAHALRGNLDPGCPIIVVTGGAVDDDVRRTSKLDGDADLVWWNLDALVSCSSRESLRIGLSGETPTPALPDRPAVAPNRHDLRNRVDRLRERLDERPPNGDEIRRLILGTERILPLDSYFDVRNYDVPRDLRDKLIALASRLRDAGTGTLKEDLLAELNEALNGLYDDIANHNF